MTPAKAAAHARAEWNKLRQAVRTEAKRRGMTVADLAEALGRGPSSLRSSLALRTPASAALQDALRGWLRMAAPHLALRSAQAAGGASEARHGGGLAQGGGTSQLNPAPAPPSWDPDPRSRMCAPLPKNQRAGDIVSPQITARWEYVVLRLTDHDWRAQTEELNESGAFGFELVCVTGGVAYLRRRLG